MNNYTEEQMNDIKSRQLQAIEYLKEKGLCLAYVVGKSEVKTELGQVVWADQVQVYLADTTYLPKEETVKADKINE